MSRIGRPVLGITVGDPGGIGPEITAKALSQRDIYETCCPLVVSDAGIMEDVLRFTGLSLRLRKIAKPQVGLLEHGTMDILYVPIIYDLVVFHHFNPPGYDS